MCLHDWSDLASEFDDTLVLGNGASIAVDQRFAYSSLKTKAEELGLVTAELHRVFDFFDGTDDFELVLNRLWIAHLARIIHEGRLMSLSSGRIELVMARGGADDASFGFPALTRGDFGTAMSA